MQTEAITDALHIMWHMMAHADMLEAQTWRQLLLYNLLLRRVNQLRWDLSARKLCSSACAFLRLW
jgi:hypothetical protein